MRQVTVRRAGKGFTVVVGDPDARDNSNQQISVSEAEGALVLMKLKMLLNQKD